MLLNTLSTSFQKCSEIEIPESFYNRMTTGSSEVDRIFGTEYLPGLMKGVAITLTGTPGAGKCHAGDQMIEIFADDEVIEDIKRYLKVKQLATEKSS
jgi:predicted ATP-dependent serine protease